jgi:hypothetical protein
MHNRSTIELKGSLESNHSADIPLGLGITQLLGSNVQVGNVGIVVLSVMNLHNFSRNNWF